MKENNNWSETEWRKKLPSHVFNILRRKDTESPFTGKYVNKKERGIYICAGCRNELFSSEAKFESGTGWPSFSRQISSQAVDFKEDNSQGMHRIEVVCRRCGGHLGHMFYDGPKPAGKRFCINSGALDFKAIE